MAQQGLLPLNALYLIPLAAIAWTVAAIRRPGVLVANGIASAALMLPLKALGWPLLVAFHSYTAHMGSTWDRLFRHVLKRCDAAFVNSQTSFDDLSRLVSKDKLVLVPHWAHANFFQLPLKRSGHDRLRILFVGRLDEEKFGQCLRVSRGLAKEGIAELWVLGDGPLRTRLNAEGVRSWGYVENRTELATIYGAADVVWAPADSTYLSRPGVEGLAAGCALIVSDVPAVAPRAKIGTRIPQSLIPPEVGRVVNGRDDAEALALLRTWAQTGIPDGMRHACRNYAERHHGSANRDLVISRIRASGTRADRMG